MTSSTAALEPDWDMTSWFAEFDGEAYRSFRAELEADTAALRADFGDPAEPLDTASLSRWADRLVRLEDVSARSGHLDSYLDCIGSADSRNEAIARETASAAAAGVELEKCYAALYEVLRHADDPTFGQLLAAPALEAASYFVTRLRRNARFRMDVALEMLASELDVDGKAAWGRLYDRISGSLEFELAIPGKAPERRPVAATRSLLESPDPAGRRAALGGANAAWEGAGDVVAACLNGIAGARHTLYARRGVAHFLDPARFDAGIERETLEVMLGVVEERAEIARGYLRRKARLLGVERMGFQDLMAPLPTRGEPTETIDWDGARQRVVAAFDRGLKLLQLSTHFAAVVPIDL